MELTAETIREKAREYERTGLFEEERERLGTLPDAFAAGEWTWDDVEWVVRWKSNRSVGYFQRNDWETVEFYLEKVRKASRISWQVTLLTHLEGVSVTMATAILLFTDPSRHTVLDWRAWGVLHEAGYLPDQIGASATTDDYLVYLGACWSLAAEFDVSLRDLDRALWVLGEELDDGS